MAAIAKNREAEAVELDREIRQYLNQGFIEAGKRLIKMRDTRLYEKLPEQFETFEKYVRNIEQMTVRNAARIIQGHLVIEGMADEPDARVGLPPSLRHIDELVVVSDFRYEDRLLPQGANASVPISLADPGLVVARWNKVVKKWDVKVAAWRKKKENRGKNPRPMPSKHVRKYAAVRGKTDDAVLDYRKIMTVCRMAEKLKDKLEQLDDNQYRTLGELAQKEKWNATLRKNVKEVLNHAKDEIDNFTERLASIRL